MTDTNIYELIEMWCKHQQRTVYSLYSKKDSKLTRSTLRSIRESNNPEFKTIELVAEELQISVPDFFAGPKEQKKVPTEKEWMLIESLRRIGNQDAYELILHYVEGLMQIFEKKEHNKK